MATIKLNDFQIEELKADLHERFYLSDYMDLINSINAYYDELDHLTFYEFYDDSLEELYDSPLALIQAWQYGSDNNSYHHDYFRLNAYRQIETMTDYQVLGLFRSELDEIVEHALKYYDPKSETLNYMFNEIMHNLGFALNG